jgi:hypothetical protein
LVGIAGEDDIDAPDLKAPVPPASAAAKPTPNRHGRLNGGQSSPGRSGSKVVANADPQILSTEASATLRDQLMSELKEIASSDDAAVWAHRTLRAKNSLTEADARQVEAAFQAKLATLEDVNGQSSGPAAPESGESPLVLGRQHLRSHGTAAADGGIDKSQLAHPEPRRFRDKEHVKFVAKLACLILRAPTCGRPPSALRPAARARPQGQ